MALDNESYENCFMPFLRGVLEIETLFCGKMEVDVFLVAVGDEVVFLEGKYIVTLRPSPTEAPLETHNRLPYLHWYLHERKIRDGN